MIKPGTIQIKSGKWFVGTNLKGFRQQNIELNYKTVRQFLFRIMGGCDDPFLGSRIGYWILKLNDIQVDDDAREIVRQMKYYSKNSETRTEKAIAEIAGWLNYISMSITSCKEPKPFTKETVAAKIKKEAESAPSPLVKARMIHWSEQVINKNYTYVQKEMKRYATVKPSNSFERTINAMSRWMDKLNAEQ